MPDGTIDRPTRNKVIDIQQKDSYRAYQIFKFRPLQNPLFCKGFSFLASIRVYTISSNDGTALYLAGVSYEICQFIKEINRGYVHVAGEGVADETVSL